MGHNAHLRKLLENQYTHMTITMLLREEKTHELNGSSFEQTWIWHQRMHYGRFGWNWSSGSWEEDFFNFVNVFSLFCNYLPLGKGRALHWNKLESPSLKNVLCQVWLKLVQWFLRRFLKLHLAYEREYWNIISMLKLSSFSK